MAAGSVSPAVPPRLVLPGGAQLFVQEDHLVKTVALQAWVHVGAADDPEDQRGLAHLTERLLLHEQAHELADRVTRLGGEVSSWTTLDHTVFHVLVPANRWSLAVDLLGDVFGVRRSQLGLDEAALHRQQQAILTEQQQEQAAPGHVSVQALFAQAFRTHPYRHSVLGSAASLRGLTLSQVAAFVRQHYQSPRVTWVAVGDVEGPGLHHRLTELLPAALSPLPIGQDAAAGVMPPPRPQEPPQQELQLVLQAQSPEVDTAQVLLGFHIPSLTASTLPEIAALQVAGVLLGYGDSSRLQRELSRTGRSEGGSELVAQSYTAQDPGLWFVGASCQPAHAEDTLRSLWTEVLRLADREVSPGELVRAQRVLLADSAYLRETPSGHARRLGYFASLGLSELEFQRALQSLTPQSLRTLLQPYLSPTNLTAVVRSPQRGAGKGAESLASTDALSKRLRTLVAQTFGGSRASAKTVVRQPATRPQLAAQGLVEHTLPSGTRLLILPEHSVEVVAVAALWPGGLRLEDERTAGLHQLLARLWPRTSRARTADAINRELEPIAGTVQPALDLDTFGLRAEFLASGLDAGLALLADCLTQPNFADADTERERRAFLQELRGRGISSSSVSSSSAAKSWDLPSELVSQATQPRDEGAVTALRLLKNSLLPTHPYRLDATTQSVASLTRRRLLEFVRRAYPLNRLTLAIVGDVDPAVVIEQLETRLGPATPTAASPPAVVESVLDPAPTQQHLLFHAGQHAHLVLGFPAPGLLDPSRARLEVLFELLTGPAGRLSRELKERRGLAFGVSGLLNLGLDPGYLAFYLTASAEAVESAQTALREELHKLVDHPVPEAELRLAIDQLLSRYALRRQRREGRALDLAKNAAHGLLAGASSARISADYATEVSAVTVADVQQSARRYLDDQRAVLVAVLPESLSPALQRRQPNHTLLAQLSVSERAAGRAVAEKPVKDRAMLATKSHDSKVGKGAALEKRAASRPERATAKAVRSTAAASTRSHSTTKTAHSSHHR